MNKIKEIWNKISDFLSPYIKTYRIFKFLTSKTFLFILVLILAILVGRSCAKMRDDERTNNIHEQNIIALKDTITKEKTKSNSLQSTIAGFILSVNDLERINDDLYAEVMDQNGRVISLNKTVFQLKQDSSELRSHVNYLESIISQPIQINDSTLKISWTKRYDWDKINYDIYEGQTFVGLTLKSGYAIGLKHYDTEILSRLSQVEITLGQKIEDKQLRIFVKTDYPGFTAKSLEGVLIDPNTNKDIQNLLKKKRWLPNTFSVGVGPSFGYNVFSNKIYLGIGVNINYNFLQW